MKENSLQDEIGDNRLNGMSTMLTMQIQTKRKNKRERVQKGWRGSTLFNEMKSLNVQERQRRIYMKELALAFLLLTASARSLLSAQGIHFYFLLFQGISFLLVGLDLIGEQVDWIWKVKKKKQEKDKTL